MREAELFDGTVLEFPDGTPDEVIARVAKDQTAQRQTAPAGGDVANRVVGAVRSALPSMMGAPNPAVTPPAPPAGPGWANTIDRLVAQAPRGVREGVSMVLGLPVDAVNNAPRALNLLRKPFSTEPLFDKPFGPVAENPVGGSESIDHLLGLPGAATGALVNVARGQPDAPVDIDLAPRNPAERAVRRTFQEVGGAAVPAAGAISIGGRMGAQAARNGNWATRAFVEPAAVDPARYAGKEMAAATAAGTGAAGAGEAARAVGYEPGAGTELGGALAGLGLYGIGAGTIHAGKNLVDAIFRPAGYQDQVVRDGVTGRLAQVMGGTQDARGVVDTDPLIAAITGSGNAAEARIPGFRASLADRTRNPQVAGLEYGRQSVDETGQFAQRRADNTAAIDRALGEFEPQGNPGALRSELELERNRRLTDAEVMRLNAEDEAARAGQVLQPRNTAEGRGADLRNSLVDARGRVEAAEREAWAPIGQADAPVDMAPLAERYQARDTSLSETARRRFRPAEADTPRRLTGSGDPVETGLVDASGQPIVRPPEPVRAPLREITDLRSALSDDMSTAVQAGRSNEARVVGQYRGDLDASMAQVIPPELQQQYAAARGATLDKENRFGRAGTAIGDVLAPGEGPGRYAVPDNAVPPRFVQPNEGRLQDFDSLLREAGQDPRARGAVEDHIRAQVRERGLMENPEGLREFTRQHRRVLNEFPDLRGQLDQAAGARQTAAERAAAQTGLQRELGTETTPGRSPVGQYLRYGDEKSEQALRGLLANKDPRRAAEELLEFVNNAPSAVEGGRRIFWDVMQKDARAGGATTKTLDGSQPWNPARLAKFLDNPSNRAVAEVLYRDNPEHLKNIVEIKDAIQGVDVRNSAKAPNSSGTPQGQRSVLTPESLQSRFYAYARGQVGLPYLATSIAATLARNSIRKAQAGAFSRLLDEALLNPEIAAQLLKENNPANRAALARRAKTWAAPEVSNFITDDDDETMDAVKRKAQ